ncbi:MAG: radical SAM family RiPP maturation amino acid epimerase [Nostoc sp.]
MTQKTKYTKDLAQKIIPHFWKSHTLCYGDTEKAFINQIKRFMERWNADPKFREKVSLEPEQAINSYQIKINPEEIRLLWDAEFPEKDGEEMSISKNLKRCLELVENLEVFDMIKSSAASSSEPHFKAWRQRQIARTTSQFKKNIQDAILHAPVCFELSKGCSVGCWFCGVSAPRLGDIFLYNQENAKLWHEVLEVMKEILGPGAGAGFCYWATDPLDNPDYEKFAIDFHKVLGMFPSTTTAQPMKDPARTRALLKLSREKGCLLNRFSIISLKILNQVHEEFSPEELAFVKLVLQNKESTLLKASTGRVREQNLKKGGEDNEFPAQGTIACVTGFLVSMVERSVKLISPCNANDRWPLGYIVYDQGTFSNVDDFKTLIERMITVNMPSTARASDLISFRPDLKYEILLDGFQLSNRLKTFKFCHDSYLRELGDAIYEGGKTTQDIVSMFNSRGVSPAHTSHYLNLMFDKGVLDDEPKPKAAELKMREYAETLPVNIALAKSAADGVLCEH